MLKVGLWLSWRVCLVISLFLGLSRCMSYSVQHRVQRAMDLAKLAGFSYTEISAGKFTLAAFYRRSGTSNVNLYVEGDGFAYVSSRQLSWDPTPRTPMGLMLAIADPGKDVIYLGRPCQYVGVKKNPECHNSYWSSHRFAEEVLASYDEALDQIKSSQTNLQYHLVGYSGGGAVVTLLAGRRSDVKSIRTVAGYLDHVSLNQEVGVAPLFGSLDPIKTASLLRGIAQVHYAGSRDMVIPQWVAKKYAAAVGDTSCVRTRVVKGFDHKKDWVKFWHKTGHQIPLCF